MNNENDNYDTSWYEVRADDEKVAAFAPISRDGLEKAFKLVDITCLDLYRDKVLTIVAFRPHHANPTKMVEQVIFETHPTVWDWEPAEITETLGDTPVKIRVQRTGEYGVNFDLQCL